LNGNLQSGDAKPMNRNMGRWMKMGAATTSLAALSLVLSPVLAATDGGTRIVSNMFAVPALSSGIAFTPAAADPRLAAAIARSGVSRTEFHFTPAAPSARSAPRQVRVAVRARATTPAAIAAASASRGVPATAAGEVTAVTPTSYNLGASLGWKKFAVTADKSKADLGLQPGGRETAEIGVNYSLPRLTGRVAVSKDKPAPATPRLVGGGEGTNFDLRTAYRVTRNVEVQAGARYRIERDRLAPLADNRRDSQAVYVGTAFKF